MSWTGLNLLFVLEHKIAFLANLTVVDTSTNHGAIDVLNFSDLKWNNYFKMIKNKDSQVGTESNQLRSTKLLLNKILDWQINVF